VSLNYSRSVVIVISYQILKGGVVKNITVKELHEKMNSDDQLCVIDVRTPSEVSGCRVEGVRNISMDTIANYVDELKLKREIYLICNSGTRSAMVCKELASHGMSNLINVSGGIQAWKKGGLPFVKGKGVRVSIMRQVLIVAGALIVGGVVASQQVNFHYIWLPGFVGVGLLYAGISGNCFMAKLLSLMPWNK